MCNFKQQYQAIINQIPSSKISTTFKIIRETIGNRHLVLYGAGRYADVIWDYCNESGLNVTALCDKVKQGIYVTPNGEKIPIVDLDVLFRKFPSAIIVICSLRHDDEIYTELTANGLSPEQIVRFPAKFSCFESPRTFRRYLDGYSWHISFSKKLARGSYYWIESV